MRIGKVQKSVRNGLRFCSSVCFSCVVRATRARDSYPWLMPRQRWVKEMQCVLDILQTSLFWMKTFRTFSASKEDGNYLVLKFFILIYMLHMTVHSFCMFMENFGGRWLHLIELRTARRIRFHNDKISPVSFSLGNFWFMTKIGISNRTEIARFHWVLVYFDVSVALVATGIFLFIGAILGSILLGINLWVKYQQEKQFPCCHCCGCPLPKIDFS